MREQRVGQVGARVDEVLAVVEYEQRAGVGEALEQPGPRVAAGDPLRAVRQQARLAKADRAEYGLRHVGGIGDRGELGDPDSLWPGTVRPAIARCAVRRAVPRSRGDLGGQPRLARAAGADQRDQPVPLQRLPHPGHLVLAADEAGELRPQVGAGGHGGRRRGRRACLTAQHSEVHGLDLRARVDAEVVGETGPQPLVGGQRVGLPPGGGQRPHQQPGELLVQRVLRDERLKLGCPGGGPAGVDLPGEEGRRRLEPQLLKAVRERHGEVPGVRQRRPAPQRQRLGRRPPRDEPLEAQRVHVIRRDGQPVPGRRLLHGRRAAQRPAGPGHQGLQRVRHVGGRIAVPDGLGERAGAHRLPARQRQPGDQAAQPRARHGDQGTAVVVDLEWPEYRDPHGIYCACGRPGQWP